MRDKYQKYCDACGFDTWRNNNDPIYKGDCPNHQRVIQTEEGPVYAWEEFNQDGEEW
jgi:hypothetical protein